MTDSNRLQLSVIKEVTYGTTPTPTPRMRLARLTGESIAFAPNFINTAEIRSDRMLPDPVKVNETNNGGLNWELSYPEADSPYATMVESVFYSTWTNTPTTFNDGTADSIITDAGTTANTFVVNSALGSAYIAGMLVKASGFTNSANNQVFRVTSSTATTVVGTALSLTAETAPPATAKLKVVGLRGAAGDIAATSTGLTTVALSFVTMGLVPGMWIKIGGTVALTGFLTAANNAWVRVTAVAATVLTLDNLPTGWAAEVAGVQTVSLWFGDWIKNGVTRTGMTIERGFLGQTVPTYISQTGMIVGQAEWNFTTEQIITGSFTFEGLVGSQSTTSLDASPDAATTNRAMSANVNVARIAEGGSITSLANTANFVRSVTIRLNNNLRPLTAVGTVGRVQIGAGECTVEGTVESYFESNALFAKMIASTATSLNLRSNIDSQAVVIELPRVTFTAGSPSAGAKNQDVLLPLTMMSSIDTAVTNAHIFMNRVPYYE